MTIKDITQFLFEVKGELAKVVWPKFDEFVGSTVVVLFLVVLFMIYLGTIDLCLTRLAKYVFTLYSRY